MTVPRRSAAALLLVALATACCTGASASETAASDTTATTSADRDATASATTASATTASATTASATTASATTASATTTGATTTGDAPPSTWARRLTPLLFRDVNTLADVTLRLYKDDGSIDDGAAAEVERVLWAAKDEAPPHVSRRLLQLVVKVAEHFDAHEIQVISSHRGKARKGSRHRTGEAIDFLFPGVPAKKLADELRTYARVGVGVYVHPKSQFVHLDVREQSYHWIDGSPPRRSWREQPLPDPTATARDAAYTPSQDLPESAK